MKLEIIKKFLDDLAFKDSEIEYNVRIEGGTTYRKYNTIRIEVFVEVDKMISEFPRYDYKYVKNIYQLEDMISSALSFLSIPSDELQYWVTFEYVNMDEMDEEIRNLTSKLRTSLMNEFNINYELLFSNEIGFYFYGSESDNPYMKIEFSGDSLFDPDTDELLIDDEDVIDIAVDIYRKSKLYDELELEILYPIY